MSTKPIIYVTNPGNVGLGNEFEHPYYETKDFRYVVQRLDRTTSASAPVEQLQQFSITRGTETLSGGTGIAIVHPAPSKDYQAALIRDVVQRSESSKYFLDALPDLTELSGGRHQLNTLERPGTDIYVIKQASSSMSRGMWRVRRLPTATRLSIALFSLRSLNEQEQRKYLESHGYEILGFSTGFRQSAELIACPDVPNIKAEYRIIAVNGKILVAHERERKDYDSWTRSNLGDDPIQTATCKESYDVFINTLAKYGIVPEAVSDIEHVVKVINLLAGPSFLSLDLFITEDGKWGIFEYSNQSGSSDVTDSQYIEITTAMLATAHKLFLSQQAQLNALCKKSPSPSPRGKRTQPKAKTTKSSLETSQSS